MTLWRFDPIRQCFESWIAGISKETAQPGNIHTFQIGHKNACHMHKTFKWTFKTKKKILGSRAFSGFFLADLMHVWIIFFFIAGILLTSEFKEKTTLTMNRQNWSYKTASFPKYSKEQESLFASWSRTNWFTGRSKKNTSPRRKTMYGVESWWWRTEGKWWAW